MTQYRGDSKDCVKRISTNVYARAHTLTYQNVVINVVTKLPYPLAGSGERPEGGA